MEKDEKKEALKAKLKSMTEEDRTLFREALQEENPDSYLSIEEVLSLREMLGRAKVKGGKKAKGFLDTIDEIFGVGKS